MRTVGHILAMGGFLVPALGVGVAIALTIHSYSPLVFEPTQADASESQVAAVQLPLVDTSEIEKSEGPVQGASLDTSDLGVDTSNLKDGTYTGSGTGYSGTITVRVTISGGKITNIEVVSTADGDPYFSNARAVIQRVIDAQSTSVDTVSGATYSSRGILQAIRNALAQASGGSQESLAQPASLSMATSTDSPTVVIQSVDTSNLIDGTYIGAGRGFQNGTTVMRVTVSGGRITNVENVSNEDQPVGRNYFGDAFSAIVPQVISMQSVNVDTVSGATYSSRGILEGIRNALAQATGKGSSANTDTPADNNNSKKQDVNVDVPDVDTTKLKDGTYTGYGRGFEDGETAMQVVIADGKIVSVENLSNEDTEQYWSQAQVLMQRIVDQQTVKVDTVSGATYSSRGILEGVAEALQKAQAAGGLDTSALEEEIAQGAELKQADYTEASWANYQESLEAAQAVIANAQASQEDVDNAASNLSNARESLERNEPTPSGDTTHYQDGEYIGFARCESDEGEDAAFDPYYVAVRLTVQDGLPQPIEIVDPSSTDAPVYGTSTGHEGDPVLLFDESDNTYLSFAINGRTRTRRGVTTTYESVLSQIVTYVREHGEAPASIDTVSGATYSSNAIRAAYQDALQQAADAYLKAHPENEADNKDIEEQPSTDTSAIPSTSGQESEDQASQPSTTLGDSKRVTPTEEIAHE